MQPPPRSTLFPYTTLFRSTFGVVPPGFGIVHQVNLEYLARGVHKTQDAVYYPDSLVGTDSHTTMINGIGVVGWGVGGIEADRKSTRLNSSHRCISYAVFCL